MAQDNAYLRRALMDRLKVVGMCPDMHNDLAAVKAVCVQTGASSALVAKELAQMRVEVIKDRFERMGVSQVPHPLLASTATTRSLLARRKGMEAFQEENEKHSTKARHELIMELGEGFGELEREGGSPTSLSDAERKRLKAEMYGSQVPSMSMHP